jgi:anti-anti-sigma factor
VTTAAMTTPLDMHQEPTYEIESADRDAIRLVDVRGEIDLAAAPELSEHLLGAADAGVRAVVVDLCRVSFLDSSGLAALLNARKRLRAEDVTMIIACEPGGRPERILQVTGLHSVVEVAGSREQALDAVAGA